MNNLSGRRLKVPVECDAVSMCPLHACRELEISTSAVKPQSAPHDHHESTEAVCNQ